MPFIHDKGTPEAEMWVVCNRPVSTDEDRKYLFSGGTGFMFDKMMREAGINDYFVTCYFPDTSNPHAARNLDAKINQYQPKIIIVLDAAGAKLCPELVPKRQGKSYNPEIDSEISKYCGSLLRSPNLNYPHYIMPLLGPSSVVVTYKLRDQLILDLIKAKYELDFYTNNRFLQPLPSRKLVTNFSSFDELLFNIDNFSTFEYISNDIETIYPKAGDSLYGKTPGLPIVVGLASSKDYGISFDFFRESKSETRELWKHLYKLFGSTKVIGQNFFNFDLYYYEYLGFEFPYDKIYDTLIRHSILFPELPHSLQYMTRQYTREPYYKDEGQGWHMKNMQGLKRYNALDATVTYEVFEAQEEEFDERPWLR